MQQDNKQTTGKPMVVSIKSEGVGNGTGFFVTENLIATNIHCIAGASSVSAKHIDSDIDYVVDGIVAYDALNDLVILKVDSKGTPFPIYNSDQVEKGETVKAIGCPCAEYVHSEGKFHSTLNNGQWLLTTAKTNDGYSGGPLLNDKGQIIGINFGGFSYDSIAITSNILKSLLSWARPIEPLAQWQKREQIRAYDYFVKSKTNRNPERAIADLDKTIQLNPDYIIAYYNRGEKKISLAKSKYEKGDFAASQRLCQSAIDDYNNIIRRHKDYTTYNNRADAKLHLVKTEAKMGIIKKSQNSFQNALTDINFAINENIDFSIKDPGIALCYHTRGEIKEAMGDLHGAIEDFKNAIKNAEYTKNSTISIDLERVKEALTKQDKHI